MKVEEIKAYAEEMISVAEKGGTLTPFERSGIVTMAMSVCGRPFDEQGQPFNVMGAGSPLPVGGTLRALHAANQGKKP